MQPLPMLIEVCGMVSFGACSPCQGQQQECVMVQVQCSAVLVYRYLFCLQPATHMQLGRCA